MVNKTGQNKNQHASIVVSSKDLFRSNNSSSDHRIDSIYKKKFIGGTHFLAFPFVSINDMLYVLLYIFTYNWFKHRNGWESKNSEQHNVEISNKDKNP